MTHTERWIELIAHRAQSQCHEMLPLTSLDVLYSAGIKSFEVDVFSTDSRGVLVCHPDHDSSDNELTPLESIIEWTESRDAIVYLDIKYPHRWKPPIWHSLPLFMELDKHKFFLISYDADIIKPIADVSGLICGCIMNQYHPSVKYDLQLLPYDALLNLMEPREQDTCDITILTGVNSIKQISRALAIGYNRFMTDNVEILHRYLQREKCSS